MRDENLITIENRAACVCMNATCIKEKPRVEFEAGFPTISSHTFNSHKSKSRVSHIQAPISMCYTIVNPAFVSGNGYMQEFKAPVSVRTFKTQHSRNKVSDSKNG